MLLKAMLEGFVWTVSTSGPQMNEFSVLLQDAITNAVNVQNRLLSAKPEDVAIVDIHAYSGTGSAHCCLMKAAASLFSRSLFLSLP